MDFTSGVIGNFVESCDVFEKIRGQDLATASRIHLVDGMVANP